MNNDFTPELISQMFAQESDDPFLTLVTLTNVAFTIRLVNNSRDVVSNGFTFTHFPMKIRLPVDDGETSRDFAIDLDNVSLDLIENLRAVTGNIGVKIQMILASMPDAIQMETDDLLISTISYNAQSLSATVILDNFLAIAMTSEKYTPKNYPGLFQ